MIRLPPILTRVYTLFTHTTLFRSASVNRQCECLTSEPFNGDRSRLATANAQCCDTTAQAALLHRMDQGNDQSRARGADRVTKRTGRSEEQTSELQSLMSHSYAVSGLTKTTTQTTSKV